MSKYGHGGLQVALKRLVCPGGMSNRCVVRYEWTASWAVSSCPFALQEVTITSVIIKKASILCNHGSNDPPSQNRFTFRAFWSFLWSLACFDCPVRLKMKCNVTSDHVQPTWLDVADHFYTFYVYLKRLEKTRYIISLQRPRSNWS